MSHHGDSEVEDPSTGNEKALASLFASFILFLGSLLQAVFKLAFRILSAIV